MENNYEVNVDVGVVVDVEVNVDVIELDIVVVRVVVTVLVCEEKSYENEVAAKDTPDSIEIENSIWLTIVLTTCNAAIMP